HLAPLLDRAARRSDSVPGARPAGRTGNARAADATQRPLCAPVPAAGLCLHRGGRASRRCRPGHRTDRVTRRGWALFAAMAVIWGIPYLLIKIAVGELTPASLVFLRTAIGAGLPAYWWVLSVSLSWWASTCPSKTYGRSVRLASSRLATRPGRSSLRVASPACRPSGWSPHHWC